MIYYSNTLIPHLVTFLEVELELELCGVGQG